jgi:hypothetical protein
VTRRQRFYLDVVDVVAIGLTCSNGRLDLIDLGDVDDGVGAFADAEHGWPQSDSGRALGKVTPEYCGFKSGPMFPMNRANDT